MSGPLPLNVMARRVLGIARASIAAEMEQRRAFEAAEAEGNQVVSFFKKSWICAKIMFNKFIIVFSSFSFAHFFL